MSKNNRKVALIMAGGTGGHVFPALATALELRKRGYDIHWLGTSDKIEARVVPQADIPLHAIHVSGVRGNGALKLIKAPFLLARALGEALKVVMTLKPSVVLGMGGFASGPGGLAAWLLRKPLVIHEQNAIPGVTNKVLSRLAKKVLVAFDDAISWLPAAQVTGNPIRERVCAVRSPESRYGERAGKLRILVVGGSLGATAINAVIPRWLAALPADERPEVWHQSGERHIEATREFYREHGVEANLVPFIEDMADAYAWADLVICRSGALTVSELAAVGVASVLIPFPHAVDDHQTANGRYLEHAGAAVLVQQSELSVESLQSLYATRLHDRQTLAAMAQAARSLAKPEATAQVADICEEISLG
ncbi:undecaprenyldiphospho-muramoylpentapeptide beta-N-acetylglucosaminyltransferase [Pokkaliibacter sp. CJK22405]|uniref:undecaprenyldiphospho-muramoylpentapeptide beta-N-acetylglucosaminyltransferase n=1 Tax=Pokkaliibacter sp. CJK22405 TaxID=3384615 RepID=UPI003984EC73